MLDQRPMFPPRRSRSQLRLKLLGITSLVALSLLTALYSSSFHANALTNCAVDASIDSQEQEFLRIINDHRQQNGRAALKLSSTLNSAAAWKSLNMATNGYVAHDDTPIGRTWIQRIRDCGYTYNAWIGENIAVGNGDAATTFEQWRGSPGHNDNMLGQNYTAIGIGRAYNATSQYGWYWTTEFGSVSDGYTASTPTPTAPAPTAPPPGSLPCADVNQSGRVGVDDIVYVVHLYRTADATADIDHSGQVLVNDILIVVQQYGTTC